jgi:alkylation response protein AidB-like acyl-CoA dehydrogenase
MATEIIKQAGSADQRNRLIEALVQGRAVMTVAHAEAAEGLSPSRISATARREEGGYVLTGRKDFILQGALADTLIVSALLDGEPALFLVDPAAENLIRMTYDAIDGRSCDSFVLDGVRIPDSDRLPGPARIALDRAFALAALATCAEAAGIAAAVNAATLEYIKTREQFAVPIGSFQVLQHRMVDMFVAEQEMDAIARRAARLFDGASPDAARWISAAKATLDRAGRLIVHQALQLHGGMGMTRELAVGDYLKRMLLLASLYGDARWHLLRLEPGSRETASGDPAGPQAPVRRVAAHAG